MGKTPALPDPGLDAKLDSAFPSTAGGSPLGLPPKPKADPRMGIPEGWSMINTLMSRILAQVGPVLKSQTNTHQNYSFRGIDQVVNAVNAAFKEHQVFPTSRIEFFQLRDAMTTANKPTREATLRVIYRFNAPDGSFVETEVPGEALDTSDKTTPKAMSVALRIALLQMLLLPTDEPTTDHDYLTRDGVGAMAASVSAYLLERLASAPLAEVVGPIRAMISEHSGWDRPAREGQATWAANYADRLSWIIDEAPDMAQVTHIHGVLNEAGLLNAANGSGTMVDQLKARWTALRDLYHNTLNHVTAQILAAQGVDELEIAIGCGYAALEAGSLRVEDLAKAEAIAEERRPKLPEHAPQPEADPAEAGEVPDSINADLDKAEAADPGYLEDAAAAEHEEEAEAALPPTEEERQKFVARATSAPIAGVGEEEAIRNHAVFCAIAGLLEGSEYDRPARAFGTYGYTLVRDAITAAHRRDHTIGNGTRDELDRLLAADVAAQAAQ